MTQRLPRAISRTELICLIAALMALNSLAIDIMLPALPAMGAAFAIPSENERQYVITCYMLGYGMGEILFGPLSDRYGRRYPLLFGIAVYALAALAAIFAPTLTLLLGLRFLQGLGAASIRVIATSVVRDQYSGSAMAEVMSISFMLLMAIPILAPGLGQTLLLIGPWQAIFIFMTVFGAVIGIWTLRRMPETLSIWDRRSLRLGTLVESFNLVVTNRAAFAYGLAGTFMFASLFGFLTSAQQIYVGIYDLGPYFPVAFASVAAMMGLAAFTNSKLVTKFGLRRLSHGAVIIFTVASIVWLALALTIDVPFWLFLTLLAVIKSCFGWAAANLNSLSMEPLGDVAGTASSVFGFIQTVGGVIIGGYIGQQFDGTVIPVAAGHALMGILALLCVLTGESGRLFGVDSAPSGAN